MSLLEIRNLTVTFPTARGPLLAVEALDLDVGEGEVMGIVGESGSGKSVAMLAVMGLIRPPGRTTADLLRFDGIDLLRLSPRARRGLVGKDVAMIFQEPMTSLNPCFTIGWQIAEALRVHLDLSRSAARARHRSVAPGRHSGTGTTDCRVPASAVGGHEPAGDDRDGDRLQSAAADCRRTHDRAGCHNPEADP